MLVRRFAENERTNVTIWANAIQNNARLVSYADEFFENIKIEEEKRAELLAETYKRIANDNGSKDLTFYVDIIRKNTTIPVILTTADDRIINYVNVEEFKDSIPKVLRGNLKDQFTEYKPIIVNYSPTDQHKLYYKESLIFTELRNVLDDLIESFFSEVVTNSVSVPVIITDQSQQQVYAFGNLDSLKMQDGEFVTRKIQNMRFDNKPIEIQLPDDRLAYIFYTDSLLLTQIQFFPYVQFAVIGIFFFIAYLMFSTARKSEQNQVWVGMSKETAHQLGTPLSSMLAWVELLKMKDIDQEAVKEIEKDLKRLEVITERFSKIGSPAVLDDLNIVEVLYESLDYIKRRTSKKIIYNINLNRDDNILVPLNINLFSWVIENICKNAIDAMNGEGSISVEIRNREGFVNIDITDSGKGIAKANFKTVFNPGYTSKKRGWGLGLSLAKRIINEYHNGKIFVKSSTLNQGTTFRIVLKKSL
ncbi:MAG: sensor histidine kinase [Bacteroidetes bacterium]|nr:sensor histidine kinase [Bacteroidota bacterium]